MRSAELGKVGKKIREIRKRRKMNLQDVAQKSDITAGLLSRIENFKTLPSLPVLHKISVALEVPLSELVQTVEHPNPLPYFYIKNGSIPSEEDQNGGLHQYLLNTGYLDTNIKVKNLVIAPLTKRIPKSSDQMELYYIIQGILKLELKDETIILNKGDLFYTDSKIIRSVENSTNNKTYILKVLFSKV